MLRERVSLGIIMSFLQRLRIAFFFVAIHLDWNAEIV